MAREARVASFGASAIRLQELETRPLPPLDSVSQPPDRPEPGGEQIWPWENLAFEGGGVKGIAYCGALRVLEEEGIYPKRIQRVTGASIGSLCATLTALGFSSKELLDLLETTDLAWVMQDARFGRFGGFFNIFRSFGLNPGSRLVEFIGDQLAARTGAKDVTFAQLLDRTGRELCVPVTNVTRMCTEYCHPKTTPTMPVRIAVAISMSLPVLMRPYRIVRSIGMGRESWSEDDLYVDGGLLCNYPLHAFDGWWLSMLPEDSFLRRLRPVSDIALLVDPRRTFSPINPATLGFTTFNADDRDITAFWTPEGGGPPPRPDTKLSRTRKDKEAAIQRRDARAVALENAFCRLLEAMAEVELDGDGRIDRAECEALFESGKLSADDAVLLFGSADVQAIFDRLDENRDGFIDYGELQRFMDACNVDLTARTVGHYRTHSGSVGDFIWNLLETMLSTIQRAALVEEDRHRTVPIDTDYVGTADFAIVDADREFLVESGARQTRAFLSAHTSSSVATAPTRKP
jgi:arachidonate 5-lipoxygenase